MGTGSRTLAVLSLLQSRRYWAGPELAARLEVSARTLRRDVERLRDLGYPVTAARGVDGGYQLAPGASLPPLVLDDDEAVALAVGLSAAASSAVTGMAESSVSALAKVVQVLPPRLRRRVEALNAATTTQAWGSAGGSVDAQVLTALAQTCRDGERVAFGYTAASGDRTERAVEPLRLVPVGRRWYLVGYDLDRGDWRSFRLDRVTQAHSTGVRFRPRELPGGDPRAFVQAGRSRWPGPYAVEVRVAAPAADVRARIGRWADVQPTGQVAPDGQVEPDGEGCIVRMTTDQLDWPILALSMVDADFTIVGPPQLREHARTLAARLGRSMH